MASSARLDELKKKFDENPRRYFAPLANEHRKSGDLDQAIALCRTHLPQQPAHISGHIVLAQALFEAGSLDESREIFHSALGLDPENLIALRYLGDIAREASDVSTARGWYQRVLEVDPRNDEIGQLVRELDNPRPEPAREATVVAAETNQDEVVASGPPVAAPSAPSSERFAPLSLENVDFDAAIGDAPSPASAQPSAETIDVDASWNAHPEIAELPMLEVPDTDPFDLTHAAGAESLFDAHSDAPVEDIFMTELAELSAPDAGQIDPEYSVAEAWTPAPDPETAAQPEAAAPASVEFEEGAFYLEPAPNAIEPNAEEPVAEQPVAQQPVAEQAPEQASDAEPIDAASPPFAEPESVPSIDTFEPAAEEEHVHVNVEAFADAPTAEWQTPAQSQEAVESTNANDLGLEVMEFVPPTTDTVDADEQFVSEAAQTAAPAAFVTETMAELYLQQGFRNEALGVYRELLARNPSDSSLRDRIDQIESGSMSSLGVAAVSEQVVESALRRQSAKPARSVRSFFASLASRRAPHQAVNEADAYVGDVSELAPDEPVATADPYLASVVEETALEVTRSEPQHGSPIMSAAETLASYDPFADVMDAAPSMEPEEVDRLPNVEPPALYIPMAPEPVAEAAHEDDAPRSSLDALFPDTPVAPRAEIAAQTLATAFGRAEPQGRPTRAASSELSLDKVFRSSSDNSAPADGGFSFDQFFSDSRPAGSDVAAPTMSLPETGRSGGSAGDAHDIEQFTAWLEGLKKK